MTDARQAAIRAQLDTLTRYERNRRFPLMSIAPLGAWVKFDDVEQILADLLADQQKKEEENLARVAPLDAGIEGRDLPRDNNEPLPSLSEPIVVTLRAASFTGRHNLCATFVTQDDSAMCARCGFSQQTHHFRDAADLLSPQARQGWQPIESCPHMRTVLLFAVTDQRDDGRVLNWKMATGSWAEWYEDERSKAQNLTPWKWNGNQLKTYETQPTHWMPLPQAPVPAQEPSE